MEWGILVIVLLLLFTGFVIVQETARQMHWRGLVENGDLEAIRTLIDEQIEMWRESRVPRGTSTLVWHGVQTIELLDVTPTAARISCNAEGEYALVGSKRIETSSPLGEGMKITKRLAEMLLYDVPNVKLDHAQIDVYTSFRDENGHAEPRCILSTSVLRSTVEHIDWEETEPADFISLTEGRFAGSGDGVHAIEPIDWVSFDTEAG
ncbi:MAG TPA: hypothetical protein VFS30_01875 [Dehalococcoidia bacterium]|nr:hypothetical protein [Dehalococcoidia bacterium]